MHIELRGFITNPLLFYSCERRHSDTFKLSSTIAVSFFSRRLASFGASLHISDIARMTAASVCNVAAGISKPQKCSGQYDIFIFQNTSEKNGVITWQSNYNLITSIATVMLLQYYITQKVVWLQLWITLYLWSCSTALDIIEILSQLSLNLSLLRRWSHD